MPAFHKSYEIKQAYLAKRIISKVKVDVENAIINSNGKLDGLLVEIRCPRSVMKDIEKTVTNEWTSDQSFGSAIQRHCLNVRIYDLISIEDKTEISFLPDKPYALLTNNRRPDI